MILNNAGTILHCYWRLQQVPAQLMLDIPSVHGRAIGSQHSPLSDLKFSIVSHGAEGGVQRVLGALGHERSAQVVRSAAQHGVAAVSAGVPSQYC